MTLSASRSDREFSKFIELPDGTPAIKVASDYGNEVFSRIATKEVTFAAATTGAVGTIKLFDVDGVVACQVFAVCSTDVTGSGSISVGTAKNASGLIASTTGTNIDAGEIWHDATPDSSVEAITILTKKICIQDISYTISTDTLTAGVVKFIVLWTPLTSDGNVY